MFTKPRFLFACLLLAAVQAASAANVPTKPSDRIPAFDIRAACRSLALVPEARLTDENQPATTKQCMDEEKESRAALMKEWGQFTASDKRICLGVSRQGGADPVYSELLTCLEMARDAREPISKNGAS